MEGLVLGVNTLYRLFCFFKLFPMVCTCRSVRAMLVPASLVPRLTRFILCGYKPGDEAKSLLQITGHLPD